MIHTSTALLLFTLFILFMLMVDLLFFHKKGRSTSMKEALLWSGLWIALALLFAVGVYFWQGKEQAITFIAAYLVEKSLSVDNLFVFLLIFSYFKIPVIYQHKVLFWGIIGALVMRALFIAGGITLVSKFHSIIYLFGAFLIYTGIQVAKEKEKQISPEGNIVLRFTKKFIRTTQGMHGGRFFVNIKGLYWATPLFIALVVIEVTDVVFAVDSIPAVMAISLDPFIIYTSNIFAILGLRALYFALAQLMPLFHYLHIGLALILIFVGVKMLLSDIYTIPTLFSLLMIFFILATSITASLLIKKKS